MSRRNNVGGVAVPQAFSSTAYVCAKRNSPHGYGLVQDMHMGIGELKHTPIVLEVETKSSRGSLHRILFRVCCPVATGSPYDRRTARGLPQRGRARLRTFSSPVR